MWCAAAMISCGTLAKGPVALLLGGMIGLLWLLLERRAPDIFAIRWPECLAIYIIMAAPWFVLVAIRNPGFLHFFVVHEHWQRFLESTEHGWGPWFFIPVVIVGKWPFFNFAPLGARTLLSDDRGSRDDNRRVLHFLVVWFAGVFIFFSIPRSKLAEYILPGLPPLAILAAVGLKQPGEVDARRARRVFGWYAIINMAAYVTVVVGLLLFRRTGSSLAHESFPLFRATSPRTALVGDLGAVAMALAIPASVGWLIERRWQTAQALRGCVEFTAILLTLVLVKARLNATPLVSYRQLAEVIAPRLHDGCALVSYHHFVQSIPFYTGSRELLAGYRGDLAHLVDSPAAASTFIPTDARIAGLWSSPKCVVLIANRVDLARLRTILSPQPVPIGCEGKKIAFVNRPGGTDAIVAARCLEEGEKR
jgi:4-amino-4-deoxy-L-arabinose transferase-like glycosyltransferase